jgi:hypothetical protein
MLYLKIRLSNLMTRKISQGRLMNHPYLNKSQILEVGVSKKQKVNAKKTINLRSVHINRLGQAFIKKKERIRWGSALCIRQAVDISIKRKYGRNNIY